MNETKSRGDHAAVGFGQHGDTTGRAGSYPQADWGRISPYDSFKGTTGFPASPTPDHENYPEVYNASEHYPEVVRDGNSLPEAVSKQAYSSKEALGAPEGIEQTRLRQNRLRIWLLVALLVVVVIVAVVGGVVGSGAASRQESRPATEILDSTALASVSYKRADGVSQYRVYFQTGSGTLCQSVWDSETGEWTAAPLKKANAANVTGEPVVKLGTPLAAHVYGSISSDEYEYHLFFLDVDDGIWELVSADPDNMWTFSVDSALKGNYTASPSSKLASYGRQCGEECGNATSVVVWQNDKDEIWLAGYEPGHGWVSFVMNATVEPPPVHGTSIAIVSLGASEGVMSIYVNNGNPTQFHFNITDGWTLDGWCSGMSEEASRADQS
ncbi:hypothetical protein SLS58_002453 [Diplodia intermedia]|uniref:Fucose-specific lectin n=1 Tax=Diplodia intermedia TaxID=856260 RepID=A0ABR3TZH9_9PEZI